MTPPKTVVPNEVGKQFRKASYCKFYEVAFYGDFQFSITHDTLSTFHEGAVYKTWFNKNGEKVNEPPYSSKGLLIPKSSASIDQLLLGGKRGVFSIHYHKISKSIKTKIEKLNQNIDYNKIQQSGDLYFLLSKTASNQLQVIYLYNAKLNKLDTVTSNYDHRDNVIKGFLLYDFKNDGYIDIFVFSIDTLHDDELLVEAYTTSPNWNCPY